MLRITSRTILGQMYEDGTGSAQEMTRGNSEKALSGVLRGMLVRATLRICEKTRRAAGHKG